ncbi:hypothetical protein GCM10007036_26740 [Alsobacter metallidurans]|uniref:SPOR domain-containing protein n=2 Tax=Alsobacter metallidurans TaxID=340221 RepID=A0A917MIQ8_9HYPH|nr:hypothetical protein GCM10007036_26740 [Alsobacter metallidurans]
MRVKAGVSMNELNRQQRPVIDLDELERQLREAAGPRNSAREEPLAAPPQRNDDPLAELARIVGQDDPFKSLWNGREGAGRVEPSMQAAPPPSAQSFDEQLAAYQTEGAYRGNLPYQLRQPAAHDADEQRWDARTAADERDAPATHNIYDERYAQAEAEPVYEPQGQLPPHHENFEEPPRKRSKIAMFAAVAAGLVVVGGGAYAWKGANSPLKMAGGAPPLIKAETGPSKIQPANPGGLEVPNQDRRIYDKAQAPEDLKTVKISGRTEQPLDVEQVTRRDIPAEAPATVAATTTTGGVSAPKPPAPASGLPQLGEPRRVKTVSVRPDGTIIDSEPVPTRVASLGAVAPTVAPSTPTSTGATPMPAARPKPVSPLTTATTSPAPRPRTIEEASAATTASVPAAPRPAPAAPRQQVASVQPATTPAATSSVAEPASGGYAVQLAAPQSEGEAKDAIAKLQKRFSDELSGMRPGVRKADVNGKTIYRVRVGGLSKDDATALCTKLQGAGGQCFVAKN